MSGKGDIGELASGCEQKLAKLVDGKYFILENYLKEKNLKQFEDEVKNARAGFGAGRGTAASALRAENELDAIEARFVKWYEGNEDVDDAPMFSAIISFFREAKEKLAVYRSAMACLAAGNREACMELLGKAFEKFKAAAQKACSIAQDGDERMADNAATIMRYIDLDHEMRLVEMMAPSGSKDGAVDRALSRMGGGHGNLMDLRAQAYHAKNPALQEAAAELLAASFEYQGALCAAYLFSELNG
ncbi:MAG: hypothetical protein NT157_01640 [Candidatus Micrarchaeota archaeon]|nr:hypothetical protein [Candidatus Micrarchaeota archaeon]